MIVLILLTTNVLLAGRKDSLSSFGSNSTLTGHEIDDSVRISRVRQSVRQKEEFLRTPVFREFHGRPKKLDRPIWPPVEPIRQDKNVPSGKSITNDLARVKSDFDSRTSRNGGVPNVATPVTEANSPRERNAQNEDAHEAETAPSFDDGNVSDMAKQTIAEARR